MVIKAKYHNHQIDFMNHPFKAEIPTYYAGECLFQIIRLGVFGTKKRITSQT